MKRIFAIAALASILVACGGLAHAQSQTLGSQVKTGPGSSINISGARYVSLNSGDQFVVDRAGRQLPITLVSPTQITSAVAFNEYAQVRLGVFLNLAETSRVYCAQTGSTVEWLSGNVETINDGCAFAYRVESFSRAR